jgi:hypothetical protein
MARLRLEVWLDPEGLPGCVLAGPRGDRARELLCGPGSRLVHTFEAGSHGEAMQVYNAYLGREPYATAFPDQDAQDYPDEWLLEQQTAQGKRE